MAGRRGLAIYGWEDAYSNANGMPIEHSQLKTSHDVVSQVYYNTWEGGGAMKAYQLANNGYKVCSDSVLFLRVNLSLSFLPIVTPCDMVCKFLWYGFTLSWPS